MEHTVAIVEKGHHIGVVNAGKGLIVAVFEQRTGADGNGTTGGFDEGEDVSLQTCRKRGAAEGIEDDGIVGIGECELIEVVVVHEFLEEVGAEHYGLGNHDGGIVELIEFGVVFDDIVDEGKAAAFPSERTFADACKIRIAVETIATEHGNDSLVFHAAIIDDGFKDGATVGIDVLEFFPRELFDELGRGEHCSTAQPARNVVACDVIE